MLLTSYHRCCLYFLPRRTRHARTAPADPVLGSNRYAYGVNDSINRTDPSGLFAICIGNACGPNCGWFCIDPSGLGGGSDSGCVLCGETLGLPPGLKIEPQSLGSLIREALGIPQFCDPLSPISDACGLTGFFSRDCFARWCGGPPPDSWDHPKHLTDCAKNQLQQYFPDLDLSKINFYPGTPYWVTPSATAITLSDGIYYQPNAFGDDAAGIGAIGHELEHVEQAKNKACWTCSYLSAWARSGFDYNKIPYEIEANKMGDKIASDLFGRFGMKDVCKDVLQ